MKQIYSGFFFVATLLLSIVPKISEGQYCTPTYTNGCTSFLATDYIQSFSTSGGVTNISNLNTACSNPGPNYTYYSGMTHTALPGNTVTFTVTNTPDFTENFIIWVDWNQDNTFAGTEQVAITSLSPGQTYTGNFTVPGTAAIGTTRMRIRNVFGNVAPYSPCNNYNYGEAEDYNFTVQSPIPCSGTPTVTLSTGGISLCGVGTLTLNAIAGNNLPGYTYQWQSSTGCGTGFTTIANATNSTYSVSTPALTTNTEYRVILTCTTSGLADTSNIVNIYPACYCASGATAGSGADIGYFNVTTPGYPTYANPATPPATYTSVGTATGSYNSFIGSAAINLIQGTTSNFFITQINSTATQNAAYLKLFIDFNRDGDFNDPGETFDPGTGSTTTPSANSISGTIAVPASATPGFTRMRLVLVQGGSSATVISCNTPQYTAGETEDYKVYIHPAAPQITATSNSPVCTNGTIQLNGATTSPCVTYSWTGPNSFSSTAQNPAIPNATAANAGTYTVTATAYGLTSTSSTTVAVNPAVTNAVAANLCQGSSLTFGPQTITTGGTYTQTFTSTQGCDSIVTLNVTLVPLPTPPTITSPVVYCQGATPVALAATGTGLLWYTSATGGTGSATAPTPVTGIAGSTTYYVSQTVNSCESSRDSILVVVNAAPVVSLVSSANPATCGSSNGSITLGGLANNTTYLVSYTQGSTSQGPFTIISGATGNLTIAGLAQGTYSNITATINNCASNALGPISLTDPAAPSVPIATSNSPVCQGSTLTFNATGIPGATFSWSGPVTFSSSIANPSITNVQPANAGVYSVTATLNGCTSAPATTTVVVNPQPVVTSTGSANPTTCGGTNGSITLNGLSPNTTYSITYTAGATPNTVSLTSSGTGVVTIPNLSAGIYSNIIATIGSCSSAPAGPITLSNPPIPAAPVVSNNGPLCAGAILSLSATTIAGATYTWTGPSTYSSSAQNPVIASAGTAAAGTYSVTATVNGCVSPAATTTVVVNPVPAIAATSFTNPAACAATNGSVTLTGLNSSTSYTVSYSLNSGTPVTSLISSNATGSLTISGLGAGTYSNITVTMNGCTSAPAGPVTLVNPSAPATPVANNNGPLCSGATFNLSTPAVAGATYTWTGPNSFSSTAQNPSITNVSTAAAGAYSVTVTVNNCTSAPGTTTVVVNPTPLLTATTSSNPTTCGGTNGSIALNGLTPNTSYSISYTAGATPVTATFTSNGIGNIVIPNLGAGTYTNITATLGACASVPVASLILSNPPTPAAPVAGSNGPLCAGGTLNLTASAIAGATYSWTGPNSFSIATQNPSITGVTAAGGGIYSVTATVNGCTSPVATTTVVVNPVPAIGNATANNPTTCSGTNGSISITGLNSNTTYTVTYTLNTSPATTMTATANGTGIITLPNLGAGVYSNITVALNGCTSSPAGPVTLNNPTGPATPTATNNGPVCQGGTLTLSTPTVAGATYAWTGPNSFSSTSQNPVITNMPLTGAGTYSVTVTVNNCSSLPATTTVVVNPTPATPVATTNAPICDGSTLTLNASNVTGATYSWTGPNTYIATGQNVSITGSTTANSGIYSVVATVNNCPSLAGTVNVVVNAIPPAPTVSDVNYCQFVPTMPLTATGQNLLWYTTPNGGTGSTTAPTPTSTTFGTTTWYVSQTINNCESPRAAISVTVIEAPAPPVVVSPVVYCQFEAVTQLTAAGLGLRWYEVATGGVQLPVAPTPSTNIPGTTTWYVSQFDGGCEGTRAAITVIVNPKPDTPFVPNPLLFCVGDQNAVISLPGLTWYTTPTSDSSMATPAVDVSTAGTAVYYVTQTQNNCESDRSMVVVTVNERVEAEVTLSSNVICQFETITITNDSTNPSTAVYNWNFDGGVVISGSGAGPYEVRWDDAGSKTVSLIINNFNCFDTDSEPVEVKPSPSGQFELRPDACVNEEMYVQAAWNSLGIATYDWDFADADMLNNATGAGAYRLRFETPGIRVITLTTTENGCSSQPFRDTIDIHEGPVVRIAPIGSDRICAGDEIIFQVQGAADPQHSYFWSPAEHFLTNGLPQAMGVLKTSDMIKLTAMDKYGCQGMDSMMVNAEACCTVALPEAFTPNNDGRNDRFRIITDGRQRISAFRVVNRWGQTIFETADSRIGWDGTFNGKPQDMGTYYYYLRYQCGTNEVFEKRGEVTLIR